MNSKTNFFLGLICVCMVSLSFDLSAQAPTRDPNKQPTPATTTPATTTKTDPGTMAKKPKVTQTGTTTSTETNATALKGDHTSTSACVDMNVRKGCVTYTITALEGAATAKSSAAQRMRSAHAKRVKVCASSNGTPTNICPEGAKRFKIAYEKADKSTEVDFTNK